MPDAQRTRVASHLPEMVLAAASAGVAAVLFLAGRGLIFFFDEWNFILDRRGTTVATFLKTHNGHPAVLPVAAYRVMFAVVGLRHYGPYRMMVIALHVLVVVALYVYARRRGVDPWIALTAALLLLVLGRAWEDLLWPFQIGFLGSMLAALLALMFLDARRTTLAAVMLVAAVACSGLGLPIAAATMADLVLRRRWRLLWLPVLPVVVYAMLVFAYSDSQATAHNLTVVPAFVEKASVGVVSALSGTGASGGRWLAGAAAICGAVAVARNRDKRARVAWGIGGALAFWVLTGIARAAVSDPVSSRYIYPAAVFLLVGALEVLRSSRVPRPMIPALLVVVVAVGWGNLSGLRVGVQHLRTTSMFVAAELRGLEAAGPGVDAGFRPDLARMPQVFAGTYRDAVAQLGSPATPDARILGVRDDARAAADQVLVAAMASVQSDPTSGPRCQPQSAEVHVDRNAILRVNSQPIAIRIRRFGAAGTGGDLTVDRPRSWLLRDQPGGPQWDVRGAGGLVVCDAG